MAKKKHEPVVLIHYARQEANVTDVFAIASTSDVCVESLEKRGYAKCGVYKLVPPEEIAMEMPTSGIYEIAVNVWREPS